MDTHDPLRATFESWVKRLENQSIEKQQALSSEDVEKVERLASLIANRDNVLASHKALSRWPAVAAVAGTLLILSFLLFLEPRETEVELVVVTDDLNFVSSDAQRLAGVQQLASFGMTGAEEVRIPLQRGDTSKKMSGSRPQALKLQHSGLGDDRAAGTISLDDVGLLKDTRVRIRTGGQSGKYSVDFDGDQVKVTSVVSGTLVLAMPPKRAEELNFGVGKRLEASGSAISLDLESMSSNDHHTHAKQFQVTGFSLLRTEEYTVGGDAHARQVSTIKSGRIYLEEIGGRTVDLRSGQQLRFDSSRGRIRELTVRDDEIYVAFHGWVQGMSTGTVDSPRSLMPSWLEWIQSRRPVVLLWVATIYVSGLALAVVRWLGVAQ